MKRKILFKLGLSTSILFVLSCVTVNIYFPAKEVQQAADEIVRDIRGPQSTNSEKPDTKKDQGSLWRIIHCAFLASEAWAQDATRVNTSTIRAIKASLKERDILLRPFFDNSNIGEGKSGRVIIRNMQGLNLKRRNILKSLVMSTNREREQLYAEVAKALNIAASQTDKVGVQFAQVWQRYSRPGWWIQLPDGTWKRK